MNQIRKPPAIPHDSTSPDAALVVDRLKEPGRYADGHGLFLQITQAGVKSWLFRYQLDGRERWMGLGPLHTVSLSAAREAALDARKLLLRKIDPLDQRRSERMQARVGTVKAITFQECAEKLISSQERGWRNEKHRAQWKSTLATYAGPVIGKLPIDAIDTGLVMKVLEPTWESKPETASRVRGRIEAVLDWATARGYRQGDNPARWRGHLDKLLPGRSKIARVKHHAALPWVEMPDFIADLRSRDGSSARALEFAILTAARTGEVLGARWSEMDIAHRTWTIPGERMKAGREHRVPVSERSMDLLESLLREGEFVFIGGRVGRPLSNMAMLELMRGMRPGYVPHGFRSTFRDWAADRTPYPNHVVEMALAHSVGNKVEAAYRRGDLFDHRRRLMEDWAVFCASPGGTEKGVSVRARSIRNRI